MMKKPKKRHPGGRPRISGKLRESLRVRERNVSSNEKILKKAKRLYFPEKKREEKEGVYRVRKFIYFCEHYARHIHGRFANQPVHLMKWQMEIIEKLFGTLDSKGKRKYKRFFLHIARKNGKTFLVCLLIIYFLTEESFCDPSSEIVSCAVTREQSIRVIFNTCRRMVEISPELSSLIQVRRQPPILTNVLTNSTYEPLASDAKPQLGKNVSFAIFDESHGQPNSELWDAMATSQSMREQPLFISISTAGDSRSSFYYTVYQKMKEIEADPSVEPSTLVRIFEVPEEADWKNPDNFILANPALGQAREIGFRDREEMIDTLKKAIQEEGEGAFRQYYLNQFARFGGDTFVSLDKWDLCGKEGVDYASLPQRVCYVGIDLSSTTDLTALVLYFQPLEKNGKWDVIYWVWLAGENLNDVCRRDRLPYDRLLKDWNIIFEGKAVIDVESVHQKLIELSTKYHIGYVAFDPHLAEDLKEWKEWELIPVPQQTNFLSPATKHLKEKIMNEKIRHGGDLLLRSMVESARLGMDVNSNVRLNKAKSRSRIDVLAALINAEYLALKQPQPERSVYEDRGLIFLGDDEDSTESPTIPRKEVEENLNFCPRCFQNSDQRIKLEKQRDGYFWCLNCGFVKKQS
jgi:phage terminase large subunit-like protein